MNELYLSCTMTMTPNHIENIERVITTHENCAHCTPTRLFKSLKLGKNAHCTIIGEQVFRHLF